MVKRLRSPCVVMAGVLLVGATGLMKDRPARGTLASAEPFCPGGSNPNPNVILCENFEDGDFQSRWDIGGHQGVWPASQFVLCTNGSFGFHDPCAAWSNRLVFDRAWGFYGYDARRSFTPQSDFYVRWYQYISDPFVWGSLEDKSVLLHDQANTIIAYVGTSRNQLPVVRDSGPGMPFVANYQDVDTPETGGRYTLVNRFQNQDRNITLRPGRWYLFEWYVKLNAPGTTNGLTRLWIDDASQPITAQTLRMQYTDMRWLRYHDIGKQFGVVRLTVYDQRCDIGSNTCPPRGPAILNQSQRWDNIVVSRAPIGPIDGVPVPPVPTQPGGSGTSPPRNLRVDLQTGGR
jgi:hypothetical protein